MVTLSVIIPAYNAEKNISFVIACLLSQTMSDLQVIVVDDGSTDKTGDICDSIAKGDSRVIVYHTENRGVSSARNLGIEKADGIYITFMDSDDWIEPHGYEMMLDNMQSSAADMAMCGFVKDLPGGNMQPILLEKEIIHKDYAVKRLVESHAYFNPIWNKIYRAEIIKENNISFPVDLKIGEDAVFNIIYMHYTHKIINIPQTLYHYVIREGSAMNSVANHELRMKSRFYRSTVLNELGEKEKWLSLLAESYYKNQIRDFGTKKAIPEFNKTSREVLVQGINFKKLPFKNILAYVTIKIKMYPYFKAVPLFIRRKIKKEK